MFATEVISFDKKQFYNPSKSLQLCEYTLLKLVMFHALNYRCTNDHADDRFSGLAD